VIRILAAVVLLVVAGTASADKRLSIAKVEARLFLNYSGTLSKPITAKTELWNAVIGEGNISEPSNSTFVDVLVDGEPGSFDPKARVELVVATTSDGKVLQTQSNNVGALNASGKYHVGFWIPRTGCEALRLRARVAGSKVYKTVDIPFACGE